MIAVGLMTCCTQPNTNKRQEETDNGIYYWRTTFNVSPAEQQFLADNNIRRLYLRMFDVDMAQRNMWENTQPQPVATLLFRDTANLNETMQLIDECVPTVFITLDALKSMQGNEAEFANKITTRILNMCSYNGFIDKVHEAQIDCDWTTSTEDSYFLLLSLMRSNLKTNNIHLSTTIRLHQLRTDPPPADRGVLMIYNTGSLRIPETDNSILTFDAAVQYLKNMDYALPLDYAFSTFSWGVWFRKNQFMAILHKQDYSDATLYKPLFTSNQESQPTDHIRYEVLQNHTIEGHILQKGDIIRFESSDCATIQAIKNLLPFTENTSIILYHLDENNLNNFTRHETETLYSRPAN